jgi:hypothetical protein
MTIKELATLIADLPKRVTALEVTNQSLVQSNNDLVALVEHHDRKIEKLKDIISPRTYQVRPQEIGKAVAEMEERESFHEVSRDNF